ncbi:MAG: hypothetical protein EKK53_27150 [Burkholderiales bacterium]|nr:MAG: hypothetical protein EKK53_27150 [Burkholderiales bacterium]
MAAEGLPSAPVVDQEWRDRFILKADAAQYCNAAQEWQKAQHALHLAQAGLDQRAELRAAAAAFIVDPRSNSDKCPTFQRYLAMARAGGSAYERELFDLSVAVSWELQGPPCAGQLSKVELEALAHRLGDPARRYYVLESALRGPLARQQYDEVTAILSQQLEVAVTGIQRASRLSKLSDVSLMADPA